MGPHGLYYSESSLIDTAQLDMTGYEDVESLDVSNFRIMSIGDLSTDFNEKWDNEIGTLN